MSLQSLADLTPLIVSLLASLVGLISAIVKVLKEKRWNEIKSTLCDLIVKAEQMGDMTGEEKKNAVLTWAQEFCSSHGYKFNADQVSSAIETLINFSKKVNTGAASKGAGEK